VYSSVLGKKGVVLLKAAPAVAERRLLTLEAADSGLLAACLTHYRIVHIYAKKESCFLLPSPSERKPFYALELL